MKVYVQFGLVSVLGLVLSMGGCPGVEGDLGDLGPLATADIDAEVNNIVNNYYGEHEVDPRLVDGDVAPAVQPFSADGFVPAPSAVEPETEPVVADAGEDLTFWDYESDELSLSASASQGEKLVYDWMQIGGPANLACDSRRSENPTFTMSGGGMFLAGTYEFELMVSDGTSHDGATVAMTVLHEDPVIEYSVLIDGEYVNVLDTEVRCFYENPNAEWPKIYPDSVPLHLQNENLPIPADGISLTNNELDDLQVLITANCPLTFRSKEEVGISVVNGPAPFQYHTPYEVGKFQYIISLDRLEGYSYHQGFWVVDTPWGMRAVSLSADH